MTRHTQIEIQLQQTLADFQLEVDLSLPAQGVTGIFGPSGCGKTSLLRGIAGLSHAQGTVRIGETVWQQAGFNLPAHQRAIGMVFQDSRLFPHLNVLDNIKFGYKQLSAREQQAVRLDDAIALLGLSHLLKRFPYQLSGGEKQRVAIARALANCPQLLLMDEPLASLDLHNKQRILPYLQSLQTQWQIPVLYVSHSLDEMARIADHLVLMQHGSVRVHGPLQEVMIQARGDDLDHEDASTVLFGDIAQIDKQWHLAAMHIGEHALWFPHHEVAEGKAIRMRLLARDVSISLTHNREQSIQNVLPATLAQLGATNPQGKQLLQLALEDGQQILAELTARAVAQLKLKPGMQVWAQIKSVALIA